MSCICLSVQSDTLLAIIIIDRPERSDRMIVASRFGKRFHYGSCSYAKRIKDKNLISYTNRDLIPDDGRFFCKCCSLFCRNRSRVDFKDISGNNKKVICRYDKDNDVLEVITPYSAWKIVPDIKGKRLLLYHANSSGGIGIQNTFLSGYHKQKTRSDTVSGYLEYIRKHDEYRSTNPVGIRKNMDSSGSRKKKNANKIIKRHNREQSVKNVISLLNSLSVWKNAMA